MVVDDVAFVVVESVVVVVKVGGKMLGLVVWCKKKNVKPEVLEQAKVLHWQVWWWWWWWVLFWCSCNGVGSWRSFNCNNDSAANSRYSG